MISLNVLCRQCKGFQDIAHAFAACPCVHMHMALHVKSRPCEREMASMSDCLKESLKECIGPAGRWMTATAATRLWATLLRF